MKDHIFEQQRKINYADDERRLKGMVNDNAEHQTNAGGQFLSSLILSGRSMR